MNWKSAADHQPLRCRCANTNSDHCGSLIKTIIQARATQSFHTLDFAPPGSKKKFHTKCQPRQGPAGTASWPPAAPTVAVASQVQCTTS